MLAGGLFLPPQRSMTRLPTVLFSLFVSFHAMARVSAELIIRNFSGTAITELDLGNTIAPVPKLIAITIENTGSVPVEGLMSSVTGTNAADFTLVELSSTTIPAASSVSAKVRFAPQALGTRTAGLQLSSTTPDTVSVSLGLSGMGSTVFNPVFTSPTQVQITATLFNGSAYFLGTTEIQFPPHPSQELTLVGGNAIVASFSNSGSGPFPVIYAGRTYSYFLATRSMAFPYASRLNLVLDTTGKVDQTFYRQTNGGSGTVAVQPDGKIIVTGSFTAIGGTPRERIARLNPDGSPDASFTASSSGGYAYGLAIAPDGKILMAGSFTAINGVARSGLARLHPDGSLDKSFVPEISGASPQRVAILADGRIAVSGPGIVAGEEGAEQYGLAMFLPDGEVDASYQTGLLSSTQHTWGLAVQADGKVLLGGTLAFADGTRYFSRFLPDGTRDPDFNMETNNPVSAAVVLPDGKILAGGHFTQVGSTAASRIARLNADGSLDGGFVSAVNLITGESVASIAVQSDGRIIIGGTFTKVGDVSYQSLAKLEADGSADHSFFPEIAVPSLVTGLAMDDDGSVYVCGANGKIGSLYRTGLHRLSNDVGISGLSVEDSSTIRWSRQGSAPELSAADFEISADGGASWTLLGPGQRVADGWEVSGLSLPAAAFYRAKGKELVSTRGAGLLEKVALVGRVPTALESWRGTNFGSMLNAGRGRNRGDADGDGIPNLVEYGFDLDPKVDSSGDLPVWTGTEDGYQIGFDRPSGVSGVFYEAEWSETMEEDDWHPVGNTGAGDSYQFLIPYDGSKPSKFFRLRVSPQ